MTLATVFTLVRIAFVPFYMFLMHMSRGQASGWMIGALAVFVAASVTDFVDGYIARKYSQVSDLGKFLDPLADKLLVLSAMTMFCQWDMMAGWAFMLVLTREFSVTGLRMVAAAKGKVIAACWSGKVKTVCTMIGLCAWMAFPGNFLLGRIVVWVIVITTMVSGVDYFIKNGKCLLA